MLAPRLLWAIEGVWPRLRHIGPWLVRSREFGPETYDTVLESKRILCSHVAIVSGRQYSDVLGYLHELDGDSGLKDYFRHAVEASSYRWSLDAAFQPGRRLAYYLLVRALRPALVVEAGSRHGHASLLVSRALQRNRLEGYPGDFLGIERDHSLDAFLWRQYPDRVGNIIHGDSSAVLAGLERSIDLFIHESSPQEPHCSQQIASLRPRLTPHSVVAVPWQIAQYMELAEQLGWAFIAHQDAPLKHWYAGSRFLVLFRERVPRSSAA